MASASSSGGKSRKGVEEPTDPVTQYALAVGAGKIIAGPWVRAACSRHLRDMKGGKKRGLVFDDTSADRAINFFERVLKLNGGEFEGLPFLLAPWQKFIIGSLFGWKVERENVRRFRNAFIEIGKGNGKSPLAAGIGVYMLVADAEDRAEIYAAATKKDQAMIMFRDAVAMVDLSKALAKRIQKSGVGEKVWNLAYPQGGSWFRPISADDGQSGPRPHCALIDEIHEHKSPKVVNMMRAGTKGRRQALIVEITNSGFDTQTICYQHHEYSISVVKGDIEDDSWFAYVCALDEKDDPFKDEKCWVKANPNLGVSIQPKYLKEQVREAKGMPANMSTVQRLNFCMWVGAENPWIDAHLWIARESEDLDLEDYKGRDCWVGLDLGAKRDMTAASIVFPNDDGETADVFVEFWTPQETLVARARKDRVSYDLFVEEGHLVAVPGRTVDYAFVAERFSQLAAHYNLLGIAFDPWRIDDLLREFDDAGLPAYIWTGPQMRPEEGIRLIKHAQGFQGGEREDRLWMPRSVELLEHAVINGSIRIRYNKMLRVNAENAVMDPDPKGNRVFDKRKSTGRIDGLVALAMGYGAARCADQFGEGRSVYEDRGLLFI